MQIQVHAKFLNENPELWLDFLLNKLLCIFLLFRKICLWHSWYISFVFLVIWLKSSSAVVCFLFKACKERFCKKQIWRFWKFSCHQIQQIKIVWKLEQIKIVWKLVHELFSYKIFQIDLLVIKFHPQTLYQQIQVINFQVHLSIHF